MRTRERGAEVSQTLERSSRLASREHSFLAARIASALQIAAGRPEVLQARLNSLDLIGTATVEPPLPRVAASVEEEEWEGWSGFDLLPPRFAKYIAGLRDNHDSPAMPWYPDLDARTIWDVLELDIVRDLHARAADIAAECAAIDPARFESAAGIADLGPDWRIVLLVQLWHPDVTADEVTLLEGLARHARARGESVSKRAAKPAAAMLA